jgi:predicted DNA-binding protein (MmcQ/YjbR family)
MTAKEFTDILEKKTTEIESVKLMKTLAVWFGYIEKERYQQNVNFKTREKLFQGQERCSMDCYWLAK